MSRTTELNKRRSKRVICRLSTAYQRKTASVPSKAPRKRNRIVLRLHQLKVAFNSNFITLCQSLSKHLHLIGTPSKHHQSSLFYSTECHTKINNGKEMICNRQMKGNKTLSTQYPDTRNYPVAKLFKITL